MVKVHNILCCSGGGAKGAFQVGAIDALTEQGITFDGFVGVSTGALQSAYMSLAKKEEQMAQANKLVRLWGSIRGPKDIYSGGGYWSYLKLAFGAKSLYNPKGLRKLINKHYATLPKVPLRVGYVRLHDGEFVSSNPNDVKEMQDSVLASSTIPFAFPPVRREGWVDGGIRNIAPLGAAFGLARRIQQQRKKPTNFRIFLVLASPFGLGTEEKRGWADAPALPDVTKRAVDIMTSEIYEQDYKGAVFTNEMVRMFKESLPGITMPRQLVGKLSAEITLIIPKHTPYSALDFDPQKIGAFMGEGRDAAIEALGVTE